MNKSFVVGLMSFFLFGSLVWAQSPANRPKFKKVQIALAGKKLNVELADTNETRSHGLMFIEKLPADQGMLFVFDHPEKQSFWMKNTRIPLSIGYFDKNKKLTEVLEMTPESLVAKTYKNYPSEGPVKYALEMNSGWFKTHKVSRGSAFKFK